LSFIVAGRHAVAVDNAYDPFERGSSPVQVSSFEVHDKARDRVFPCDIWQPADEAPHALVLYSHHSGGHRRRATFLCEHLSSHGYMVAALDHSEVVAPELRPTDGETAEQAAARIQGWIAGRVPDIRVLLDHVGADAERIGIVGHSFGGWTALAAPDVEPRIESVVAHAPAGVANPKPGVIPATLAFDWAHDIPTLVLAAEHDVPLPLPAIRELFDRIPATKLMVVLRDADHGHFADNVEQEHEAIRAMAFPAEGAWIPRQMRPIGELCSGGQSHLFTRGLTLAHLDATLRQHKQARQLLDSDLEKTLAARGVAILTPVGPS